MGEIDSPSRQQLFKAQRRVVRLECSQNRRKLVAFLTEIIKYTIRSCIVSSIIVARVRGNRDI